LNLEFVVRAMLSGIAPCFVLFVLVVRFQQARSRRSHRRRKKLRFYPTNMMMGLAFQKLQVFVHPEIDHTNQQKYVDATEDDDEGDPADPQKVLARQLRRIRNGEVVDQLQVPLPVAEPDARDTQ
jgi:hypothetical protein